MDFRLSDETLEWQQYCRKFAREVDPPGRPQARPRGERPLRGDQGGLPVEPGRPRLDHVAAGRPRGAEGRDLRRGAPLGLRGHRARDLGILAVRRRNRFVRHPRADRPLDPRGGRHQGRAEARRLRGHRAAGRLRREVAAHDRQARRRRLDPERHQDLHLQRRHRGRDRGGRHRRPAPRPPWPGLVRRHQGQPRPSPRPEGVEARYPRIADGRDRARGLPRARRRAARRRGEAPEEARACPFGQELAVFGGARDFRAHAPDRRARRPSGSPRRHTSGRSSTSPPATTTAGRCSRSSASSR